MSDYPPGCFMNCNLQENALDCVSCFCHLIKDVEKTLTHSLPPPIQPTRLSDRKCYISYSSLGKKYLCGAEIPMLTIAVLGRLILLGNTLHSSLYSARTLGFPSQVRTQLFLRGGGGGGL